MTKDKILIIGANGQIGSVLTKILRQNYGHDNVIPTDIHLPTDGNNYLPFEILDATDSAKLAYIIERYRITQIYHLAAILSAKGEINPLDTWNTNMDCLFNVLDAARHYKAQKVFFSSTIAVFGSNTPRVMTPQDTIRTPETVFGMSKVAGENWCSYFFNRYGVDVRGLRFPGLVSSESKTGSSATDYASDMIHSAVKEETFECYVKADTRLPMIFIDDAVRAATELMEAPAHKITIRSSYNLMSMSFAPADLAAEIKKYIPGFRISYKHDSRNDFVNTLPESIDDTTARRDWNWTPQYDLGKMTEDAVKRLKKKLETPKAFVLAD
jgi:nucleoside-diphosphate-sugar epimerase